MGSRHNWPCIDGEFYLKDYRIIKQPGDNSCLFHSVAYALSYTGIVDSIFDDLSGHYLRALILEFMIEHPLYEISYGSDMLISISDYLSRDGYSCSSYFQYMSDYSQWGGSFELSIVVEMFPIKVCVFEIVEQCIYPRLLGTYSSIHHLSSDCVEVHLLYTGYCHYDCLVDGIFASVLPAYVGHSSKTCMVPSSRKLKRFKKVSLQKLSKVGVSSRRHRTSAVPIYKRSIPTSVDTMIPIPKISSVMKDRRLSKKSVRTLTHSEKAHNRLLRRQKRDAHRISIPSHRSHSSKTRKDCQAYSKYYDEYTRFIVCAICGIEGPQTGTQEVSSISNIILSSGIKEKFLSITSLSEYSSGYDRIF